MSRFEIDDASLEEAYSARRSGNVAAAIEICRRILAVNPAHHGAHSLVGVCFAESGNVDKARPLIEGAVNAEPQNWRLLLNLSVLREFEGRIDQAIESARGAASNAPDRFEPWGRLGELSGRQGDFDGAAIALEKAVALNPDHPGMTLLLAAAAYETGRYELSVRALDRFDKVAPRRPESLRLRTHLARKRMDWDAFVDCSGRWLSADPMADEARVALAFGHAQQDEFHAAVEIYRPLVQAYPRNADHSATFAQYLLWSRDFEGADRFYSRALEIDPGHAGAAAGMARLHIYKGRFGQAASRARNAIESDPANVDAYAQLLQADASQFSDEDLAHLQSVASDPAIEQERRAIAWFTLGDAYHRRHAYDRAFDAWKQANELKRSATAPTARYDPLAMERLVDRLIASFAEIPHRSLPTESGVPIPIFIVGMPRAGTTLLDSALSGHAQISSGGELPAMPSLLKSFLEWADGAQWHGGPIADPIARQIRDSYLQQYADYRIMTGAFVTDKQPLNFQSLGLIRQLFPEAPIIHIRRHPLETGFSIYRNNFTTSWPFTTALADIGHYYGQYVRLMKHWENVFNDGLMSIQYENLVCDFEGEIRRLIAHVGLEWDPNCLTYFQRDSIVTTLSSAQVRRPPSKEYMNSTAPYVRALQPLQVALEQAGVDIAV